MVASEVKGLATQTAKATEDIIAQVTGMQSATDNAVSAMENIDSVIRKISEITTGISSAVEEQSAGTAAETVLHAALEVDKVAEQLRADIMSFFDEVKAA